VLRSLTGAFYPMDRPDLWREFWSRVGPTFQVQPAVAANQQSEPHTQANGFFGIPVHGTRVVFVLDLSGSMAFDLASRIPNTGGRPPARLDRAIEELVRAVDGLPEYASFNLVTFANGPKAERWRGDLVAATSANKHLLAKYVKKLRADGGTNTWAGLSDALEIKSAGTDERYDSSVDEVFLLSDGMPSVGRVVDAREILMLVRETNYFSKVRINTVYIADEMTDRDQLSLAASGMPGTEFMERLARENNGTSVRL